MNRFPRTLRRLVTWLPLVWLLSVVVAHYAARTQASAEVMRHFLSLGLVVLAPSLLVMLAGAAGRALPLPLAGLSRIERAVIEALLGLGLLSFVPLMLGLLGWLPPPWLGWAVMLISLVLLWRQARAWLADLASGLAENLRQVAGWGRWLQVGSGLLLACALVMVLAPPTAWDALTYHLAGPRTYLDAGRIIPFAENHFLGFPQLVSMLYLWLLNLAPAQGAALLHFYYGVGVLLLLIGFTQRLGQPMAGWVGIVALLGGYSFWLQFSFPYNDLALGAYVTAALVCLFAAAENPQQGAWLMLAGAFTGMAMGVKYTAAGAAVGLGLLCLWLFRAEGFLPAIRRAALLSVTAVVIFLPWLLKNLVLYGNPVAPFGPGTAAFDGFDQWYYLRPGTGLDALSLLLAPLQGAVFGQEGRSPYGAASGALLIGLLPLAGLGWRSRTEQERRVLVGLLVFLIPAYGVWLYGAAVSFYLVQTRLLFGIFPAAAMIGGLGVAWLHSAQGHALARTPSLIIVALVVLISLGQGLFTLVLINPLPYALGLQSEADYLLTSGSGAYTAAMQRLDDLPEGAVVQFLWEPRYFYCRAACLPDSLINEWWRLRQTIGSPQQIAEAWRAQDVTHVLIFEEGMNFLLNEEPNEPLTQADVDALYSLQAENILTPLWTDPTGTYSLYQLVDVDQ